MMKIAFVVLLFLTATGCQVSRQTEDYKLRTISDITLTPTNHQHGYARRECFLCHNPANIHLNNRLNSPLFDLAKPLVDQSGETSCAGCHGSNGVSQ
ncbi:MAG: hypothetical protein IT289_01930 [Oligoflexia bacterium]|nr:hypothetical protein [Oligoflexia bacterium]